jgi:hypothetical protein
LHLEFGVRGIAERAELMQDAAQKDRGAGLHGWDPTVGSTWAATGNHYGILPQERLVRHFRPQRPAIQCSVKECVVQIPILIERINGNGYRARGGEPLGLSADADTREGALAALREQLRQRLNGDTEMISLEVSEEPHPLARFAGMFKHDPLFESWQKSIAKYRREVDADSTYR